MLNFVRITDRDLCAAGGLLTAEAAVLGFWKPGWFRKKDPADSVSTLVTLRTAADPEAKTLTACTSSFSDYEVGTIDNGFTRIADPGTPNAHPEICTVIRFVREDI